eukprot:762685-Hanusia_phi.AAC.3
MGSNKPSRMRIIFLNQYVVFDPLIFGPLVDSSSILLHHSQIHGVSFANQFQATTVVLHFSEHKDDLADDLQFSCELTFQNASRAHQIHNLFERITRISAESGFSSTELVYQNPAVAYVLHKCGKVHHLGKKEVFRAARSSTSLFFVYAGEVKLCRPEGVHKIVRKGFFFGMSNFVQCKPAATYSVQGGMTKSNIVLELPRDAVAVLQEIPSGSTSSSRSYMHARFFHYLCSLLEREYRLPCVTRRLRRKSGRERAEQGRAQGDFSRQLVRVRPARTGGPGGEERGEEARVDEAEGLLQCGVEAEVLCAGQGRAQLLHGERRPEAERDPEEKALAR